jgi:glycerol-3-phosphate dehydrogenase (NAD(P)+)
MSRVAVIGAGSWGTALANLLASNGHDATIWAYEPEVVESINKDNINQAFLEGCALDPRLRATSDIEAAVTGADLCCAVTPSHVARAVLGEASPFIRDGAVLVSATKGIEPASLDLMHEVAAEVVPQATFVALSGPSFAREVHQQQPTAVVAASHNRAAAQTTQELFSSSKFRVYSQNDVVGVEVAGALKNVIAIAAGVLEGLGLGYNPMAALLTRGLSEIGRLGEVMGADPHTFSGLAGMGDLILTCTGGLSRNRALGMELARGVTLEEHKARVRTVAEGVNTAVGAAALAGRHHVEMPITEQIRRLLFDGGDPEQCIKELMERDLKAESSR